MTQTQSAGDSFPDPFHTMLPSAPFHTQDLHAMRALLDQVNASAVNASKTLSSGFANASASGKSFNDVLGTIAESLAKLVLRDGAKSLTEGLSDSLGSLFSGLFGSGSGSRLLPMAAWSPVPPSLEPAVRSG